jgi:hypothetical protein
MMYSERGRFLQLYSPYVRLLGVTFRIQRYCRYTSIVMGLVSCGLKICRGPDEPLVGQWGNSGILEHLHELHRLW